MFEGNVSSVWAGARSAVEFVRLAGWQAAVEFRFLRNGKVFRAGIHMRMVVLYNVQ